MRTQNQFNINVFAEELLEGLHNVGLKLFFEKDCSQLMLL